MLSTDIDVSEYRDPERAIEPLLFHRWSPRAMSGEKLSDEELMTLLEAARWAPSSYNAQPWVFLYAPRDSEHWDRFFGLLAEGNRKWASRAGVLMLVASRKRFEHNDKPAPTHAFDAGAAWQNLALQATRMGLVAHGMQGFDYEKARERLGIPEVYQVQAMIAVGKPGRMEDLPDDIREREKPSGRKRVAEFARQGKFG